MTHIRMCTCICLCVSMELCEVCMYMYIRAHIHTTHAHTHKHTRAHIHRYTHARTHARTHTHTHTYIHTDLTYPYIPREAVFSEMCRLKGQYFQLDTQLFQQFWHGVIPTFYFDFYTCFTHFFCQEHGQDAVGSLASLIPIRAIARAAACLYVAM